jgi:hypothetical protein
MRSFVERDVTKSRTQVRFLEKFHAQTKQQINSELVLFFNLQLFFLLSLLFFLL